MQINHGLEKIGKTRFGTLYWAGYALGPCLPPIQQLVTTGVIRADGTDKVLIIYKCKSVGLTDVQDTAKLAWMKNLRLFSDFQIQLQQLVCILEPIARAIKCLEGLQVTVGDVWKFYVAITAVLHDLFLENSLGIPEEVQEQVRFLVNKRYQEMIEGPSGDLYLSGFYLDPRTVYLPSFPFLTDTFLEHVKSPILLKSSANQLDKPEAPAPVLYLETQITDQDLRDSMPTYAKVGVFLLKVLATELKAGRQAPQFASYKSATDVMTAFRSQFEAFTRQYPPFSARSRSWTKPYLYWTAMLDQSDAGVLAVKSSVSSVRIVF
jgi:hypothetical protein